MNKDNDVKKFNTKNNISPVFNINDAGKDRPYFIEVLKYEGTPDAILYFAKVEKNLTDYGYWFLLSTLWVSYSGFSDLNLWRQFFKSKRKHKIISIMKPDEVKAYIELPKMVKVYRAHRENENDWLSYTTSFEKAKDFLKVRDGGEIKSYWIYKKYIIAYFLRRGEFEVLVTEKNKQKYIETIEVECDA